MVALPVPPDPSPIVELAPMNETLASVTTIYEAALPESVAVLPAAAVILGGIKVETTLLNNQRWDNFWIGVGGHLTDVWHAVGSHLFGGHSAPSLDTVTQLIQLSMHVSLRATRQLVTGLAARTAAVEGALHKGVVAVANSVNGLGAWTGAQLGALRAQLSARILQVEREALGADANLVRGLEARIAQHTTALRAEIIRDLINPLRSELHNFGTGLDHLHRTVVIDHAKLWTEVAPAAAVAATLAHEAVALARAAKAWEDDCGEPMCEVVGPKTDWGKLLKRFGPAAIFAMLAAIAAENPKAVEDAATELGDALGPVLASWAEAYLGLVNGDPGSIAKDVGGQVGQFPF